MKPPITIMIALLILCAVCSCSKNSTDHPNEGSILRMYKTTYKDTSIYYYIYERDANNRLVSMRDSSKTYQGKFNLIYGSNTQLQKAVYMNGANALFSYEFEYNADGHISKRKTRAGTFNVEEEYHIYVYDAAGHLTTDSQYTTVNNRTYTLSRVSKFNYTGENITVAEGYGATSGTLVLDSRLKYDYDNGFNPFAANEYEYYINEANDAIYAIYRKSANNVVKNYSATGNGDWTLQSNINYKYNSSQFAWKATAQNVVLNEPAGVTEYFYQ